MVLWLTLAGEQLLKSLSKFWVKDSVNDGIEKGIHVTKPRREEKRWVTRIQSIVVKKLVDCVQDVASEERDPAHQKRTWKTNQRHFNESYLCKIATDAKLEHNFLVYTLNG